jgi:hypothetical protein
MAAQVVGRGVDDGVTVGPMIDQAAITVLGDTLAGRTGRWLDRLAATGALAEDQRVALAADDARSSLDQLLRRAELAGHDPARVLADAVTSGPLDDATSVAHVLHFRISTALDKQLTRHHELRRLAPTHPDRADPPRAGSTRRRGGRPPGRGGGRAGSIRPPPSPRAHRSGPARRSARSLTTRPAAPSGNARPGGRPATANSSTTRTTPPRSAPHRRPGSPRSTPCSTPHTTCSTSLPPAPKKPWPAALRPSGKGAERRVRHESAIFVIKPL